jgi:hypothetical protein
MYTKRPNIINFLGIMASTNRLSPQLENAPYGGVVPPCEMPSRSYFSNTFWFPRAVVYTSGITVFVYRDGQQFNFLGIMASTNRLNLTNLCKFIGIINERVCPV